MTPQEFLKAINEIDINIADKALNHKKIGRLRLIKFTSVASAILIIVSSVLFLGKPLTVNHPYWGSIEVHSSNTSRVRTVSSASYPELSLYPDEDIVSMVESAAYDGWNTDNFHRRKAANALTDIDSFYKRSIETFLSESSGENLIYSPINVYIALSMLAEITDANSRAQILDLLGVSSIEELRKQAENLWRANYRNDGITTSVLANSVWLNEKFPFNEQTLNTLSEKYFASVFSGDVSSKEMTELLRKWLNEETGGLLKDEVDNIKLDPNTIITLCSTVYFKAKWQMPFDEAENTTRIFHSPTGNIKTTFMNSNDTQNTYYWGDGYGAVNLHFNNGGSMWLILPDEDKSVDDILHSGEYLDMIKQDYNWNKQKNITVNLSLPKFDVSSNIKLEQGLRSLSVTDVFDSVGNAEHTARVVIDEDGCKAAALTIFEFGGIPFFPEEKIDFILDRPFLFVIESDTTQPLFAGVVNNP